MKIKTYILVPKILSEIRAFSETILGRGGGGDTECVVAFPLPKQKWLVEQVIMLRFTYVACFVILIYYQVYLRPRACLGRMKHEA